MKASGLCGQSNNFLTPPLNSDLTKHCDPRLHSDWLHVYTRVKLGQSEEVPGMTQERGPLVSWAKVGTWRAGGAAAREEGEPVCDATLESGTNNMCLLMIQAPLPWHLQIVVETAPISPVSL